MAMQPPSMISHHQLSDSTQQSLIKQTKANIVIIFDFDDTLFPSFKWREIRKRTNSVNITNDDCKCENKQPRSDRFESNLSKQERLELTKLSYITYNLLLLYVETYSKRNICIVTSSAQGWVKQALTMVYNIGCYSLIYHLIFDINPQDIEDNISIYHPSEGAHRSIKEIKKLRNSKDTASHPSCIWKFQMFKRVFHRKAKISEANTVVIIGDSRFEYIAAKRLNEYVGEKYKDVFVHRIKLERSSTIDTLKSQQNVLFQFCQKRYYHGYSLLNQDGFDFNYSEEKNKLSKFDEFFEPSSMIKTLLEG